ncbi:metallophosphoesterase [Paraburkholderia sp. A2RO-4L]|jgi:serine/threonine protein phosphatase 1|uniref:metallophosphoesterase n=1 Tax=Paraburkholderia sp. A2RO-4L TaxID=3028374 RepID=UPI003DA8F47B
MTRNSSIRLIQRLGEGKGRDFVVGDIHGMFNLLRRALRAVNFNPAVDRLFSVGDLVDRGFYSVEALEFLRQPWFHVVRGNHEQMVLDLYETGTLNERALAFHEARNGMGWWRKTPPAIRAELLNAFFALPLVIELETARGTVGFIHAEVPQGLDWPVFIDRIEAGDWKAHQSALWGRTRIQSGDDSGVTGIGRVFAGHTPQFNGATRLGNCFYVDTGAVFGALGVEGAEGAALTLADTLCQTVMFDSHTPQKLPEIDLFQVLEPALRPFGQYTKH